MNSQAIAKVIFLIFVIVVAGYIMYTNNNTSLEAYVNAPTITPTTTPTTTTPTTTSTTTSASPTVFSTDVPYNPLSTPTPQTSSTTTTTPTQQTPSITSTTPTPGPIKSNKSLSEMVKDAYKDLYGAEPKREELDFYVKFFQNRDPSPEYLREIISTSAPTLQKTLTTGTKPDIPDTPLGTEKQVIDIYEHILERHPNAEELAYYSAFIKQSPDNIEKMKVLLLQSNEYKRLQQLQDNTAYGHLLGGVTDRQVTIQLNKVYSEVGGNPDTLDEDTFKFLKKKFLEFELNEPPFKDFLKTFVMYDPRANKTPSTGNTNASGEAQAQTQSSASVSPLTANSTVINQLMNQASSTKQAETSSTTQGVNTSAMIDTIKDAANCQFNKNSVDDQYRSNKEDELARTVNDRNKEDMKMQCDKSATTKHDKGDMVLLPGQEWSIPQKHTPSCYGNNLSYNPLIEQSSLIGTLLTDAKDTEIGSIMPKFTYKEMSG